MTLTHAASQHVGTLFSAVRAQLRIDDSGHASVVGDHEELRCAQEAMDLLFSKMRMLDGMVYASRLRPVTGCSLSELAVLVGVEAPRA